MCLGTWVGTGHPDVSEALSMIGFDWIVFDTEHGPHSVETVQLLMQAMGASPTIPLVRVAWNDPVMIKRALDVGAYGVVVPWINSKADAIRAVRACRYPRSGGIRGVGLRRAAKYGFDLEYIEKADEEMLVVVQIETEEALRKVDDIFSVQGVDACFIGPGDLSMSLGIYRKFDHPRFKEALKTVLTAAKRSAVAPGIHCGFQNINERIQQGFQFVALSSDMGLLLKGCKDALQKVVGWKPNKS